MRVLCAQLKHASALPRDQLVSLGCTFGKFTKSKKFRLHVTCLDYMAQHAQYRVWLKPSAEQVRACIVQPWPLTTWLRRIEPCTLLAASVCAALCAFTHTLLLRLRVRCRRFCMVITC